MHSSLLSQEISLQMGVKFMKVLLPGNEVTQGLCIWFVCSYSYLSEKKVAPKFKVSCIRHPMLSCLFLILFLYGGFLNIYCLFFMLYAAQNHIIWSSSQTNKEANKQSQFQKCQSGLQRGCAQSGLWPLQDLIHCSFASSSSHPWLILPTHQYLCFPFTLPDVCATQTTYFSLMLT